MALLKRSTSTAELADVGMTCEPDGEGEGGAVWIGYYGEVYWNAS